MKKAADGELPVTPHHLHFMRLDPAISALSDNGQTSDINCKPLCTPASVVDLAILPGTWNQHCKSASEVTRRALSKFQEMIFFTGARGEAPDPQIALPCSYPASGKRRK
jgi:hypothetical protein